MLAEKQIKQIKLNIVDVSKLHCVHIFVLLLW